MKILLIVGFVGSLVLSTAHAEGLPTRALVYKIYADNPSANMNAIAFLIQGTSISVLGCDVPVTQVPNGSDPSFEKYLLTHCKGFSDYPMPSEPKISMVTRNFFQTQSGRFIMNFAQIVGSSGGNSSEVTNIAMTGELGLKDPSVVPCTYTYIIYVGQAVAKVETQRMTATLVTEGQFQYPALKEKTDVLP